MLCSNACKGVHAAYCAVGIFFSSSERSYTRRCSHALLSIFSDSLCATENGCGWVGGCAGGHTTVRRVHTAHTGEGEG